MRNDSLIVSLFQGQLKSSVECPVCGKVSSTYNPFMYLSLPIPKGPFTSLGDCLREFMKEEILDEQDGWKCTKCKVLRRAKKSLCISRIPRILLIHLKRFSFSGPFRDKIDTFVDFPLRGLDLFPYLAPSLKDQLVTYYKETPKIKPSGAPQVYDLYAISNHYGGLNGGHYTAFVKSFSRSSWYAFDDSRVIEMCRLGDESEKSKICSKAAYSLFYITQSLSTA